MLPWIRSRSQLVIAVSVLVLTVAGVVVALYLDSSQLDWLTEHPLTANLFAGLLGLPAAFLIVNLAAERAISWSEQSKWAGVRAQEAASVVEMWQRCREALVVRR